MLSSKFYLYKTEWLDLVFDKRNKEYGAYDLRKHYADNMVKAMGVTFFSVLVLGASYSFLHKSDPVIASPPVEQFAKPIEVKLIPLIEHPRLVQPVKLQSVSTIKDAPMVTAPDPISEKPITIEEAKNNRLGPETVKGKDDATIVIPETTSSGGGGVGPAKVDNTPVGTEILEVMPEPYGGSAAWLKFLQKNLRYPEQAVDAGKEGKVWLSFIIERDGHLSNIVVDRGPGFGLNEEALRVLKLAPAWKPGIQNGQAVRVKYNIPINFQITE